MMKEINQFEGSDSVFGLHEIKKQRKTISRVVVVQPQKKIKNNFKKSPLSYIYYN
jgi:hypothetical protein